MGAWGAGSFENDDAGDWVWELEEADDSQFLRAALERVTQIGDGYLEAPLCTQAQAAAEVVAALLGRPVAQLPEEARAWVEAHSGRHEKSLAPIALEALKRIRSRSELQELWDESGADEWHTVLDDLERRLKG